MHEGIGLTIIAYEETKALHCVEKLDRTSNALTCQLALRRGRLGRHGNHITNNLKILRRHLAAAIHEIVLEFLAFSEPFEPSPLNRANVHKHILAAAILLDEAETLLCVEELHGAFAGTDDLRGHAAETAATATARATGASTTAWAPRASAAAAEAIAATAKTVAAATESVAAAKTIATTAKITRWRKTVVSAAKRIKAIFAETVALVTAAAASPIVTHRSVRTLPHCPASNAPMAGTAPHRTQTRRTLVPVRTFSVA
jgi:hypothetical protein